MTAKIASIIIPAHNEAAVIGRCLSALETNNNNMEVIVVCNACKDNTVAIARSFDNVKIVETEIPSKANALNLGDGVASGFPRVYLDADVMISLEDLAKTISALEQNPSLLAVAPEVVFDLSRSNLLVKAFYAIWQKLPYFRQKHMIGTGIYILSEQGRARFEQFPNIISDDGYVRSLFSAQERRTIEGVTFRVFAPGNLSSLIKIKTRARFGNMEVVKKFPGSKLGGENTPGALLSLLARKPWLLPAAVIYAYAQWQTKRQARKRFEVQDFTTWERDESAR